MFLVDRDGTVLEGSRPNPKEFEGGLPGPLGELVARSFAESEDDINEAVQLGEGPEHLGFSWGASAVRNSSGKPEHAVLLGFPLRSFRAISAV